jgi:hypothetical protein
MRRFRSRVVTAIVFAILMLGLLGSVASAREIPTRSFPGDPSNAISVPTVSFPEDPWGIPASLFPEDPWPDLSY